MTSAIDQARALPAARPDVFTATLVLLEVSRLHHVKDAMVRSMPVGAELACIGCGCTDSHACEGGCSWVSHAPPICSGCADDDIEEHLEFFR